LYNTHALNIPGEKPEYWEGKLMIDIIGFDADDTLWHNEQLYHQAKKRFAQILEKYSSSKEASLRLDQSEVRNIEHYGYGIKSFALSMIETAVEVSNGQVAGDVIGELIAVTKQMLSADVDLVAGAEETLAVLSTKYALMLITKGDSYEQERKITRSGIDQYFRYLEVVGEKSEATYLKILGQYNLDPTKFLMVGNSLRSDILPVVRIGGRGVFIPNDLTWFHEHLSQDDIADLEFAELERLSQLPSYLANLDQKSRDWSDY
jgi:putative hydrolase of the HAD superfamily